MLGSAVKSTQAIFLKVRVSESVFRCDPFLWLLVEHLQNYILGLSREPLECVIVHVRLFFLNVIESRFSIL